MDKKMISVDDLVRQRLSGGEERERAGAWLQMRELLDKEMPQSPGGMLYWRRALSAAALLLLVASVSVGGYKMYHSTNGHGANESNIASVASVAYTPARSLFTPVVNKTDNDVKVAGGNEISSNATGSKSIAAVTGTKSVSEKHVTGHKSTQQIAAPATTDGIATIAKETANTPNASSAAAPLTNMKTEAEHVIAAAPMRNTTAKKNVTVADKNEDGATKNAVTTVSTKETNRTAAKAHKTTTKVAGSAAAGNTTDLNSTTAAIDNADKKDMPVADNNTTSKKENKATAKKVKESKTAATTNNGNNKTETITKTAGLAASNKTADSKMAGTPASTTGDKKQPTRKTANTHKTAAASSVATTTNNSKKQKSNTAKTADINKLALGSHAPAKTTTGVAPSVNAVTKAANGTGKKAGKGTGNANTATGKGIAAVSEKSAASTVKKAVTRVNKESKSVVAKNTKPAKAAGSAGVSSKGSDAGNASAASGTKKAALPAVTNRNDEAAKAMYAANMKKGKRVMEKMELYQHLIKNKPEETTSAERKYHMDTLSVETVTEELSIASDNNATVTKRTKRKGAPVTNENDLAAPLAPGATPPAANKAEDGKLKPAAKKKSGVSMIERLQSTFNDIKYNVASVQFVPGLTGGINGTFFGPNSFKGFQFGVNGEFVFNDNWSIMGELKYVHRINSNYTMNDDYNTYTYTPGMHAYEKDSFHHAYNFSTLHSFELPVTVRYTKNKMTFFGGGNLAYTLGVNPSQDPQLATIKPSYVTTPGANGSASFTPGDLQSVRFGIGYLFGFGYKIAPNMMLDFRNVQTIWDNASGAGSKLVSSQLYKSPSLQLSFTYRLGGNKDEQ